MVDYRSTRNFGCFFFKEIKGVIFMEMLKDYIMDNALILIPVIYVLGIMLKGTELIPNT